MSGDDLKLTPEQIAMLSDAIARAQRRRRIMLVGYLLALLVLVFGMLTCLVIMGRAEKGTFVGWIFFIPFSLVGLIFWAFGRWERSHRAISRKRT